MTVHGTAAGLVQEIRRAINAEEAVRDPSDQCAHLPLLRACLAVIQGQQKEQSEDTATVNALTAIVREADSKFQTGGGSSRHWTRDYFLPILNREGWRMTRVLSAAGAPAPGQEE